MRKLNNAVLSALPEPGPSNPLHYIAPHLRESLVQSYRPRLSPYGSGEDIWLHYFTAHDIRSWAEFLEHHVPGMAERYLTSCAVPPPKGVA